MPEPRDYGGHRLAAKTLHAFSGRILFKKHIRRILERAGYNTRFGLPKRNAGLVAVWGRSPRSWRARLVAKYFGADIIYVEEAFLSSLNPGRSSAPTLGLLIDQKGPYFDNAQASELEDLLNYSDLDCPELQTRAKQALRLFQSSSLSKYGAFETNCTFDQTGYVLVIDQTRDDPSIRYGGANVESFARMLTAAKAENAGEKILIKTHPTPPHSRHNGHFSRTDIDAQVHFSSDSTPLNLLIKNAKIIYCVTSPIGLEAIISGHRPRVFGMPFYGGWGLSDDEQTYKRRARSLNLLEFFTATMLLYPRWFDPYRNELCEFETLIQNLKSQTEAWQQDQNGYALLGMRLWKRGLLRRFFRGAGRNLRFVKTIASEAAKTDRGLVWASKETPQIREYFATNGRALLRLEDGFLRSRGLGANLVPPMSLVVDDLGIYYDPSRESRLEKLINASKNLDENELARAKKLQKSLLEFEVSKYNTGASTLATDWPCDRQKILVPGQVEDDASIRFGAGDIRRNIELLTDTRQQNPDAFIVYKPHPDVEAGLRPGNISNKLALQFADMILTDTDAISAINACDNVCTITSLLGFEALIRGKHVTCQGLPFYAGWGLTTDLGPSTARRTARPSIAAMIHCTLIAYPRYFDPKTGLACPVEVVVERLNSGQQDRGSPANRLLSKLQDALTSIAPIWR